MKYSNYKILVVSTYDSFLKVGINLARRINHSSIEVAIQYVKKNQLSIRQLVESGANNYRVFDYKILNNSDFSKYDIVIAALGNIASQKLITRLYSLNKKPLIITCFSGSIFGNAESISSRINSDILLVNNESDRNIAQSIASEYGLETTILNYGLINLDLSFQRNKKSGKNIFFIDQVKIPQLKTEREYVLEKLLELARSKPDYSVFLKTRLYGNEITVHKDQYPYAHLLRNKKNIPTNFSLYNDSIEVAFQEMDICISFSSTSALEAIYYGIPTYIIKDLGIRESLYNPPFLQSGLLTDFSQLDSLEQFLQIPNKDWFDKQIKFTQDRDKELNNIIDQLVFLPRTILSINYKLTGITNKRFYPKFSKFFRSPKNFFLDSVIMEKFKILYRKTLYAIRKN
ncbi:DUF6716 putative glycosyltransferase [Mannheimia haemolytica]|uniref:DUF6716 putative glycosyltransferase n=1 Tax=Mannheimia haemolytica TaxID=75985 RepID=UPI0001BCF8CE|nr:DUF6716 putative glycosyltransferase [Mannheimia haemolytica]EEY13284.1 hypothetical protein COK_0609 [Mannheimia haemolytica serotype A2 str. BOVINE]MDW0737188.1 hypothetical protein [Mannheimia haemolytica]TRC17326.1 hypothetical protein FEA50_01840 [Mannheimia haemolytica]TRC68642.1 hypothetical protein FEA31_02395 [Mannheimia haemolytica]